VAVGDGCLRYVGDVYDGQVVKMTYMVLGRFMTLDAEVVWKPYRFVGVE